MSDPNLAAAQTATVQGPRLLDQVREIAFARFGRAEPETTTMNIPDRSTFESIYAGQPPWDIGRPQQSLIQGIISLFRVDAPFKDCGQ